MKPLNRCVALLPTCAGIGAATIWGGSFCATKEALLLTHPLQLLAYRFAMAAVVLTLLWTAHLIDVRLTKEKLRLVLLPAVLHPLLYFILETWGVSLASSSEAAIIVALVPVVTTLLAALFLKERPSARQSWFIALSLAGVLLVLVMKKSGHVQAGLAAVWLLLAAVLSSSASRVLLRQASQQLRPVEVTFVMIWTAAIVFNVAWFFLCTRAGAESAFVVQLLDRRVLFPTLYLGLLSSVVAFLLSNYTIVTMSSAQSASFLNLEVAVAMAAGVFIRGEGLDWYHWLGAAMIIVGVWGTQRRGGSEAKRSAHCECTRNANRRSGVRCILKIFSM